MARTAGAIFGVVKDRDGNPVLNARVFLVSGPVPLPDIAALTDANGAFVLSAPTAGEYTIEVVSEEFARKKVRIAIAGGQQEHIEIRIPHKRPISSDHN